MSLHYEWTLSLWLRPDVPAEFLDELRYHLGLSDQAPATPTLDVSGAALVSGGDGDELAGGPIAHLVRQQPGSSPATWGRSRACSSSMTRCTSWSRLFRRGLPAGR